MTDLRDDRIAAFLADCGWAAATRSPLAGDASARRYLRLRLNGAGAVLMDADPARGESVARFALVARWLLERDYSAPMILAISETEGFLLLEDFGDDLFTSLIEQTPKRQGELCTLAMHFLSDLHRHPAPDWAVLHDGAELGRLLALLDDHYLPALGAPPVAATQLAPLFASLYDAMNDGDPVLALRDFHAGNLILLSGREGIRRAGLLDFQDAMATHRAYDVVSLLQDARRDVPIEVERTAIRHYCAENRLDQGRFLAMYALLGAQRALRILAVFARLCIKNDKPRYIDLMPRVWSYLQRNLAHPGLAGLAPLINECIPAPDPAAQKRICDHVRG